MTKNGLVKYLVIGCFFAKKEIQNIRFFCQIRRGKVETHPAGMEKVQNNKNLSGNPLKKKQKRDIL